MQTLTKLPKHKPINKTIIAKIKMEEFNKLNID